MMAFLFLQHVSSLFHIYIYIYYGDEFVLIFSVPSECPAWYSIPGTLLDDGVGATRPIYFLVALSARA